MREHLLGYLMGALDASQQTEVEQSLEEDPQLRQDLNLLDQALEPLRADRGHYDPPRGLADRTLDVVAAVAGWPEETEPRPVEDTPCAAADFQPSSEIVPALPPPSNAAGQASLPPRRRALSPSRDGASRTHANRWALLDVAASAGILAAAAMLFFPALANSRFQARIVACQSNLQTLARSLVNYSEQHQDRFVAIPPEGKMSFAGIYAPTLLENQYLTDERALFCPADVASRTAGHANEGLPRLRIPPLAQIAEAESAELRALQRIAGGSYGYNLGYMNRDQYSAVRNLRRPSFAIAADAPGPQHLGRLSTHHEGRGQNVLFEDEHIEFVPSDRLGILDDFLYSDRGFVEAGQDRDDAVIGNSHSRPILWPTPVRDR